MKNTVLHIQSVINKAVLGAAASVASLIITSKKALAQDDFELPEFGFAGADADTKPDELLVIIAKYGIAFALWLMVAFMFFTVIKVTLKTYNKSRREEETKWGEIAGDLIGSVLGFVFVLGLAAWYSANFL